MPTPRLAYLAEGKLHVQGAGGDAHRVVESAFGRSMRERAAQIQQRHAWKSQGSGAQFMTGMLWPGQSRDANEFPIAITSVCRGRDAGELLYTLETDEVSGIFAVDEAGVEQRLYHTADFRLRQISLSPDRGRVAAAVLHRNFTSNIAVLSTDGAGFVEATEGDSLDMAPRWVPGSGRRLVFQSAGIGRNGAGHFSGVSPFAIQELDLDSGALRTLAEEKGYDLVNPQMDAAGSLHYIRRPHEASRRSASPLDALKDAALMPFRLSFAVFQFFNIFSMRYTGKPLATGRQAAARRQDPRLMFLPGSAAGPHPMGLDVAGEPDAASAAPPAWQLVRRTVDGATEMRAKGVAHFDLAPDGSVVYSDGNAVDYLAAGGGKPERLFAGRWIEQVALT